MSTTWETCFDFAYRYTFFTFLPPFVSPSLSNLGIIPVIHNIIFVLRSILTVVINGKRDFGAIFQIISTSNAALRSITFFLQRKSFLRFAKTIDDFLIKNEHNPVTGIPCEFVNIWNKNKPLKFSKWLFWLKLYLLFFGFFMGIITRQLWMRIILNLFHFTHRICH